MCEVNWFLFSFKTPKCTQFMLATVVLELLQETFPGTLNVWFGVMANNAFKANCFRGVSTVPECCEESFWTFEKTSSLGVCHLLKGSHTCFLHRNRMNQTAVVDWEERRWGSCVKLTFSSQRSIPGLFESSLGYSWTTTRSHCMPCRSQWRPLKGNYQ